MSGSSGWGECSWKEWFGPKVKKCTHTHTKQNKNSHVHACSCVEGMRTWWGKNGIPYNPFQTHNDNQILLVSHSQKCLSPSAEDSHTACAHMCAPVCVHVCVCECVHVCVCVCMRVHACASEWASPVHSRRSSRQQTEPELCWTGTALLRHMNTAMSGTNKIYVMLFNAQSTIAVILGWDMEYKLKTVNWFEMQYKQKQTN